MSNKELANAFAIAKVCGFDKSIDEFQKMYSQYYNEAIKELNSKPIETAKVTATKNPFS